MTVIYIAGAMRSGTTITGQLLAASPDTVLIGELRPSLLLPDQHDECDCGQPRSSCPFWSEVYGADDPRELSAATAGALSVPAALRIAGATILRRDLPANVRRTVSFFRAVRRAAGDRIIIDTSKTPVGILLWRLAGEQVHIALCVRSVRRVAKAQADPASGTGIREPIAKGVAVWTIYNVLTYLLRPWAASLRVIRFAGLRCEPRLVAERVWRLAGASFSPDPGPTFHYEQSHVLAGNPRRARGRSITIVA